jgi:hypothetical protein
MKIINHFTLLWVCILFLNNGCQKDNHTVVEQRNKIEEISTGLLNSEIFANALDSVVTNNILILREINEVGGRSLVKEYLTLSSHGATYDELRSFYSNIDSMKIDYCCCKVKT